MRVETSKEASTYLPNKRVKNFKKIITPYVLLFPAVLFVAAILGYAVVSGMLMSLFQIDLMLVDRPFVGIQNYIELFKNPIFQYSLIRTLIFVIASIILGLVLSMTFALSLYKCTRFGNALKGLALIPYLVSGIATAIMFRFMFSGEVGLVNMVLESFGFDKILWLADPNLALFVAVLANTWFIAPFAILILLAGIQSIDPDLFEAATLDGAPKWVVFKSIILPLITPMLGISLIWLSFASFNMFDVILPLTGGGPGRATELLAVYMYKVAFQELKYSIGSAVMVVILFFNVIVSLIYLKFFKVSEE